MGTLFLFLVAFTMIIWGVRNWYIELKPYLDALDSIPKNTLSEKLAFPFRNILIMPKMIPFAIDITITLFAVGSLGMGAGLVGGITGVFLSNIISIIIVMRTYKVSIGGSLSLLFAKELPAS